MTFTETAQAWINWRNGELSTGEFLSKLEAQAFEIRVCETPALTPEQNGHVRDWIREIIADISNGDLGRTRGDRRTLPV